MSDLRTRVSHRIPASAGLVLATFVALSGVEPSLAAGQQPQRVARQDSAIELATDLDAALERARATDTPIVLVYSAVWCPVCRKLMNTTLLERSVQAFAGAFIWVEIDVDRNVSQAREWGVDATPTVFLLGSDGLARRAIIGDVSAQELADRLDSFLAELSTSQTDGPPVAQVFRHTALTATPRGYRGRSVCFSHVGYGPLTIRSQSPFQSLRLGIIPRTPSTLGRGQHQIRFHATWANTWANDDDTFNPDSGDLGLYLLDFESLDLNLAYDYGISDTVQVGAEYEQRWLFGGLMDGLIEGFHDLFGLGQAGRDRFPRNQTNILIDPQTGQPPVSLLEGTAAGTIARSLLITLQHNLTCGTATWPALSWSATLRSSLGDPLELEGDLIDVALSASASRRFGSFYLYLTLGYAWYGSDAVAGLELESSQASALIAGEWRFKPSMSLILQYLGTDGVATDLGVFSEVSHEVVLGWKWEARPNGVLEVGVMENIIEFDNSPDFGVHAGWTQRF
jgi:hypothetical protein